MRRLFIIAVVVAVAVGVCAYWYLSGSRVHVPGGAAVSIEVIVPGQSLATITNTHGLSAMTEMLRSGRPAEPHECVARGWMEARFANGRTLSVAFAPGHESSHYEFGMDGHSFTISRSQFLSALEAGGVDVQKIPTK